MAPLWISLVELTLSLPRGKTLSTSPPPDCPRSFLDLPHRLRYLYPNSPSFSLFLCLAPSVRSLLRLCFSFPRAAPACLPVFLLSSSPSPPPSFLTVGSRPRPFVPYRPRSPHLPPHPSCVPAHPYKKPKSSMGATGGFSLRLLLPSSHHFSSSPLTFPRPFSSPSVLASLFLHRRLLSLLRVVSSCYTFASAVRSRVYCSVSLQRAPESCLLLLSER